MVKGNWSTISTGLTQFWDNLKLIFSQTRFIYLLEAIAVIFCFSFWNVNWNTMQSYLGLVINVFMSTHPFLSQYRQSTQKIKSTTHGFLAIVFQLVTGDRQRWHFCGSLCLPSVRSLSGWHLFGTRGYWNAKMCTGHGIGNRFIASESAFRDGWTLVNVNGRPT